MTYSAKISVKNLQHVDAMVDWLEAKSCQHYNDIFVTKKVYLGRPYVRRWVGNGWTMECFLDAADSEIPFVDVCITDVGLYTLFVLSWLVENPYHEHITHS